MELLKQNLIRDEGSRLRPYFDKAGKITIGIGHNLTDLGITEEIQRILFENDLSNHMRELDEYLPWWRKLGDVRMRALVNMAFNLGVVANDGKLLQFKRLLIAVQNGTWNDGMSRETRETPWAHQVGMRAERIIHMFETGTDP
jgi:lysozyme